MRRRSSPFQSKLVKAVVVIVLCLVAAYVVPQPVANVARGLLHTVAWPFEAVSARVAMAVRDAADLVGSIGELKRDNERLVSENIRLAGENAALVALKTENEDLRASFGLRIREPYRLVGAEILAYGGEGEKGTMIIDRGSVSEVRTGMAVVYGEGTIVGVVTEAYPASSKVMLLSHSSSALGGVTAEHGAKGIIRGDRGLGMVLDMVVEREGLSVGDRVVTGGNSDGIPAGLFVGTIDSVRDSDDRLFRQAVVVPPVESGEMRFVSVIVDETRP